jgi:hypothetical protein
MARKVKKLSAVDVKNKTKPGLYSDGAGLYLNVGPTGGKSWLFRFMLNGKAREMGLGPIHTISLSEARDRAEAARKLRRWSRSGRPPRATSRRTRPGGKTSTTPGSGPPPSQATFTR